jgi:hypothetical protein
MFASNHYRLGLVDVFFFPRTARNPLPSFLSLEQPELMCTSSGDASKRRPREILIVLEFKPVDQTVLIAMTVHYLKQSIAV